MGKSIDAFSTLNNSSFNLYRESRQVYDFLKSHVSPLLKFSVLVFALFRGAASENDENGHGRRESQYQDEIPDEARIPKLPEPRYDVFHQLVKRRRFRRHFLRFGVTITSGDESAQRGETQLVHLKIVHLFQ